MTYFSLHVKVSLHYLWLHFKIKTTIIKTTEQRFSVTPLYRGQFKKRETTLSKFLNYLSFEWRRLHLRQFPAPKCSSLNSCRRQFDLKKIISLLSHRISIIGKIKTNGLVQHSMYTMHLKIMAKKMKTKWYFQHTSWMKQ